MNLHSSAVKILRTKANWQIKQRYVVAIESLFPKLRSQLHT